MITELQILFYEKNEISENIIILEMSASESNKKFQTLFLDLLTFTCVYA